MQRETKSPPYLYQREIESRQRIIVGLNQFTSSEQPPANILRVNPEMEQKQCERLGGLRGGRTAAAAQTAREGVEAPARAGGNLMPAIIDAVRNLATLGEISDAMRRVFGE